MRRSMVAMAVMVGALTGTTMTLAPASLQAADQACMVAPTDRKVVSSRFGIFRGGGVSNHGSTNKAPHQHDGLDFSTSGVSKPLYATTEGVVTFAGPRGSAGNTVMIQRPTGDVVAYYHLSAFAPGIRKGVRVRPGQTIGLSGNTNQGGSAVSNMAVHLHFVYGTKNLSNVRSVAFSGDAQKNTFNPNQLSNRLTSNKEGIGWRTDPAPYFCESFPISDGRGAVLGQTTKEQHALLFGNVPSGGVRPDVQFDPVQVAAANAEVLEAQDQNLALDVHLSDGDGFGALPMPPLGDYDTLSVSEMMLTEATRRFMSAEWNSRVTEVSSRALYVDLLLARGVGTYLSEAMYTKRQRIEALLAIYTSLKSKPMRTEVKRAHDRTQRGVVSRAIN